MRRKHEQMREGMHTHTHHIDWHIGHWIHDPRFWAAAALIILFGLMIAAVIYATLTGTGPGGNTFPRYPAYPYLY